MAIEAAGGEAVILDQMRPAVLEYDSTAVQRRFLDENGILRQEYATAVVRDTYAGIPVEEAMKGVRAVVFLGGGDVCPTLFSHPEPWHGIADEWNYDVARDVSEYLTMAYCLDHDLAVLGLCRGMQLLAVVSGAPLIQDLPVWYASQGKADRYVHRSARDKHGHRHYTAHDVHVTTHQSLLYAIAGTDTIAGAPSWHHQAVGDVAGTPLLVSGVTEHDGTVVIEAIERPDRAWVLGVQYHPEEAVRRHLDGDKDAARFMPLDRAMEYFRQLVQHVRASQEQSSCSSTRAITP